MGWEGDWSGPPVGRERAGGGAETGRRGASVVEGEEGLAFQRTLPGALAFTSERNDEYPCKAEADEEGECEDVHENREFLRKAQIKKTI